MKFENFMQKKNAMLETLKKSFQGSKSLNENSQSLNENVSEEMMKFQKFLEMKNRLKESANTNFNQLTRMDESDEYLYEDNLFEEFDAKTLMDMMKSYMAWGEAVELQDKYLELYQKYGEKTGQAATTKLATELTKTIGAQKKALSDKGLSGDKLTMAKDQLDAKEQKLKDNLTMNLDRGKDELRKAGRALTDKLSEITYTGLAAIKKKMEYDKTDADNDINIKMSEEIKKLAQATQNETLLKKENEYKQKIEEKKRKIEASMQELEASGDLENAEEAVEDVKGSQAFKKMAAASAKVKTSVASIIQITGELENNPNKLSKTSITYAIEAAKQYIAAQRAAAK